MTISQKKKKVHNGEVVAPRKLDLRNLSPVQPQTCAPNFYFSLKNKSRSLSRRALLNDLRTESFKWLHKDY